MDIHDQPTVIRSRDSLFGKSRPAKPFQLERQVNDPHSAWLKSLSPEARAVLEAARRPAPRWPLATRVEGAVAEPRRKVRALFHSTPPRKAENQR
jgi:hypothetical protein